MKGLVSFNPTQNLKNAGWIDIAETQQITDNAGYFDVSIPLNIILGFAEDYSKIIVNYKHEVVLTRSKSNINAIVQTEAEEFKINLVKIELLMPYVVLSDKQKIRLFHYLQKETPIAVSFRSWKLYEYPLLPTTSQYVWTVKTSNHLEKPRFAILGFQTNRKGQNKFNASHFDY